MITRVETIKEILSYITLPFFIIMSFYMLEKVDKSSLEECRYSYLVLDSDRYRVGYTNDDSGKNCVQTTSSIICGTYILTRTKKGTDYCKKG